MRKNDFSSESPDGLDRARKAVGEKENREN
jgi:hypothetical protein